VTVPIQFTGVHTQPGSRGTVAYKAPELIDDGMDDAPWTGLPTRESDIFAMGVLIWEVSTSVLLAMI
jgi:serine/threonine protein kinase